MSFPAPPPRFRVQSIPAAAVALLVLSVASTVLARDFEVKQISAEGMDARSPAISGTGLVAWHGHIDYTGEAPISARADVLRAPASARTTHIFTWKEGEINNITSGNEGISHRSERAVLHGNSVLFTAWYRNDAEKGYVLDLQVPEKTDEMRQMEMEYPTLFDPPRPAEKSSLEAELNKDEEPDAEAAEDELDDDPDKQTQIWRGSGKFGDIALYGEDGKIQRITPGNRHYSNPVISEAGIAFQVARGWPYGYEIAVWKEGDTKLTQLTTNYYYVLNPQIHGQELVFQGWDGTDYEIFRYRFDTDELEQITDNAFDDTNPVVWDGEIAWVAYPAINAEIFHYRDGQIRKISENSDDNGHPSIWAGRVVWHGYEDLDSEIYYFNGRRTIKLTSNNWDDLYPVIRDGLIAWMSYVDNSDAEILCLDLGDNITTRLSENDWEDSFPRTAGERVVWQSLTPEGAVVMMAEPKAPRVNPVD